MRKLVYTLLLALSLTAVPASSATEDYGSTWTQQQPAATESACPAPQPSTAIPNDTPAPQNVVEYGAGS